MFMMMMMMMRSEVAQLNCTGTN